MTISDQRFGAELVTTTGKVHKFDSVECLSAFYHASEDVQDKTHSVWVTDYRNTPQLINVSEVVFIHSPALHSPMGANLAAVNQADAEAALTEVGGRLQSWEDLLAQAGSHHEQPASMSNPASLH